MRSQTADAALGVWCRMVCIPGQLSGYGCKLATGQWTKSLRGGQKAAFVVLVFSRRAFMQKAAKGKQGVECSMSWPLLWQWPSPVLQSTLGWSSALSVRQCLGWKTDLAVHVPNNPAVEITEAQWSISAGEKLCAGGAPGSSLLSAFLGNCTPKWNCWA